MTHKHTNGSETTQGFGLGFGSCCGSFLADARIEANMTYNQKLNRLFEAGCYTIAFFELYAASHGHPGALFEGFETLMIGLFIRVVDIYEHANRKLGDF